MLLARFAFVTFALGALALAAVPSASATCFVQQGEFGVACTFAGHESEQVFLCAAEFRGQYACFSTTYPAEILPGHSCVAVSTANLQQVCVTTS
jgi:hypothetical protein